MADLEDVLIHAWNKDAVNLKPALDDILSAKVAEKIDAMTVDTASNMFNGETDPDEVDQPEEQDEVEVDNDDASLDIDSDESVDDLYIDSEEEEDSTDYEGTEDADQSETDSEE